MKLRKNKGQILKYGLPLIGFLSSTTTKVISKKVWTKTSNKPAPNSPKMIEKDMARAMIWGAGTAVVSSVIGTMLKKILVKQVNA